jgi:hypothetical protein
VFGLRARFDERVVIAVLVLFFGHPWPLSLYVDGERKPDAHPATSLRG